MIFIASDHRGYNLKGNLTEHLKSNGYVVKDLGAHRADPDDDYTDYTVKLVNELRDDPQALGILICKNGVGVSMMANKFKHIRCALSWNPAHAASSKVDDNSNVLALPADYVDEQTAINTLDTWLNTPFSKAERHIRRLKKAQEAVL